VHWVTQNIKKLWMDIHEIFRLYELWIADALVKVICNIFWIV